MKYISNLIFILFFISSIFAENVLSFEYTGGDSLKINLLNSDAVGGFQFLIDGINFTSASGGIAEANGFIVSGGGSVVVGFSMSGATIAPGENHLTTLFLDTLSVNLNNICFNNENPCSSGTGTGACCRLSDPHGNPLDLTLGECVEACFDNLACNNLTTEVCEYGITYYQDADGDGNGNPNISQNLCEPIDGYVTNDDDNDDNCSGAISSIDGSCCLSSTFDECDICDGDNSTCSDCMGIPNGDAIEDECGACSGDNSTCSDCTGTPNGTAVIDECGNCEGDCILNIITDLIICSAQDHQPENLIIADCLGVCGGFSVLSDCGCVAVDNSGDDCDDCFGIPNGDAIEDECGACNGDNSTCTDCAGDVNGTNWESDCGCVAVDNSGDDCDDCFGIPNGDAEEDQCGICGGDNSSCLSIQDPIPESFSINNIYPNPFNPIVSITYGVPTSQYVEGYIYNLSGDRISTLVSHYHSLGNYSLEWNATGNPSGIYIFILKTNSNVKSRKLVLLK
jgi:hypothetical protein